VVDGRAFAIHFAAFLGAAQITLIGMVYTLYPDGNVHFNSRHLSEYGTQRWHALAKHRQGDEWLARELAKQGVPVVTRSGELRARVSPAQPHVAVHARSRAGGRHAVYANVHMKSDSHDATVAPWPDAGRMPEPRFEKVPLIKRRNCLS
jgi:hypothetical protein